MNEDEDLVYADEVQRHVQAGAYFTREALARCVEAAYDQRPEDFNLAQLIREDHSFDIAVFGSEPRPEVRFFKFRGKTKARPNYPSEAVVRALEKLEYMPDYMATLPGCEAYDWWIKRFPSTVQPREPRQEK